MPNHCENLLTITGSDEVLKELFCSHFPEDEDTDNCFQCNTVIPMPVSLKITSGGHVKQYAEFIVAESDIVKEFLEGRLGVLELYTSAMISSYPEIVRYLQFNKADTKKLKADFIEGIQLINNNDKYGCTDWYPWCNHNWGTKWGSYDGIADLQSGVITAEFQSAWSPPTPVIEELSRLYPEVVIEHRFLDEGYGFGGAVIYDKGTAVDEFNADDVELFAQEEFGHEPYEDVDEEDEEDQIIQDLQDQQRGK